GGLARAARARPPSSFFAPLLRGERLIEDTSSPSAPAISRACARSLAPIFASLVEWSAENLPGVERARREFDGGDEPVAVIRRRGPAGAAAG
ncbi:hypothetical protein GTW93_41030, partial [Streptomyces sp. SID5789]|nr:hypothetical protein [Streptomyces sp. SID5789]